MPLNETWNWLLASAPESKPDQKTLIGDVRCWSVAFVGVPEPILTVPLVPPTAASAVPAKNIEAEAGSRVPARICAVPFLKDHPNPTGAARIMTHPSTAKGRSPHRLSAVAP